LKIVIEFTDQYGEKINFQKEIDEIFQLIRENKEELVKDLKGFYLAHP